MASRLSFASLRRSIRSASVYQQQPCPIWKSALNDYQGLRNGLSELFPCDADVVLFPGNCLRGLITIHSDHPICPDKRSTHELPMLPDQTMDLPRFYR